MIRMKQTYGQSFNSDREYMTEPERQMFEEMRHGGQITIFQIGACEACGADVPRSKKYCSKKCMEVADETRSVD